MFDPAERASAARLQVMADTIRHRGPNDDGFAVHGPCGLGFRRLSIIDLEGGHQPIPNEDESVWVTLNGEIYNHHELRRDLESRGHRFRTRSDTEVIVHLYEEYGLDFCRYLHGMFGIALQDRRLGRLVLVRDRVGIKPVYYWQDARRLVYGSEVKALLAHPAVSASPDEAAIFEYLWLRHSVTPSTMFQNIRKLPAGSLLVASMEGVDLRSWWTLEPPTERIENFDEAVERYDTGLKKVVEGHLMSDVPLGVFLSGGLDSSVLAALMQAAAGRPVTCFTAGFEGGWDESNWAAQVAKHIGARHEILQIKPPAPEVLEEVVWHLDEPIADPACLPTFLLAQEASRQMRVVLTGEGSDETNAGYAGYLRFHLHQSHQSLFRIVRWLWPLLRHLPPAREKLKNYEDLWSAAPGFERVMAGTGVALGPREGGAVALTPSLERYRQAALAKLERLQEPWRHCSDTERLLHQARTLFMTENLLTKVDRMTMAHGLEARVPYLDHQLVELTAAMTPEVRFHGRRTKAVLREVAKKCLPPAVVERSQHGFIVPLDRWFNGGFADYAAGLLCPANLRRRAIFDPESVAQVIGRYRASGEGARNVWSLILLELWFRRFID